MSPAAIGPHGHGLIGVADRSETVKSKFAKRTWNVLWNQCDQKTRRGRSPLEPQFRSPILGLNPFIANRLPAKNPASPRSDCLYHIAVNRLIIQSVGNPGRIWKANADAEEPGATIPRGAAGEEESGSLRIFIVDSHGSCAAGLCLLTRTLDTNPSLRSRAGFVPRLPPLGMTRREKGLSAAWRSGSTDYSSQVM